MLAAFTFPLEEVRETQGNEGSVKKRALREYLG
jgi:hypothetical protein